MMLIVRELKTSEHQYCLTYCFDYSCECYGLQSNILAYSASAGVCVWESNAIKRLCLYVLYNYTILISYHVSSFFTNIYETYNLFRLYI